MRFFQTVVAILLAAMFNMVSAAPRTHATPMILATAALVDVVASSGFQHSVIAATSGPPSPAKPSRLLHRQLNTTGGCFHGSNFTRGENDTSAWIPWTALASQEEPAAEMALFYTFSALCKSFSATILTRGIPYTHCEPDSFTNGTYAIMAQMTYLGPEAIFDMRGIYDYCLGAMSLTKDCEYGGAFDEINLWYGSPNNSQLWNVQARPIVGPCPDCTGGLLAGGGSRGAKCRGC